MQPYFLPYLGYFQLIYAVDTFIVYDNIQYTKTGWINRNRLCRDGDAVMFSLPLKKASAAADVGARQLAADFTPGKLLNQFTGAYRRAPYFAATLPLIEAVLNCESRDLFPFLLHSLRATCAHTGIATPMRISSAIDIDHSLKGQERVLELCAACGADTYVNLMGGVDLYSREAFRARGIDLQFIRMKPFEYPQSQHPFVPLLSIVDVLMFNSVVTVQDRIASGYELL